MLWRRRRWDDPTHSMMFKRVPGTYFNPWEHGPQYQQPSGPTEWRATYSSPNNKMDPVSSMTDVYINSKQGQPSFTLKRWGATHRAPQWALNSRSSASWNHHRHWTQQSTGIQDTAEYQQGSANYKTKNTAVHICIIQGIRPDEYTPSGSRWPDATAYLPTDTQEFPTGEKGILRNDRAVAQWQGHRFSVRRFTTGQ